MCRYAMIAYKPHYACFTCRKTFKRRLLGDVYNSISKDQKENPAKCPDCGALMANMGLDFKSPKMKDTKAWEHIATLFEVGITFHSCGCSGPGYIPSNSSELVAYFSKIKADYIKNQNFWAQRKSDPENQSDIAKDRHYNSDYLSKISAEMNTGTKNKPQYNSKKAQQYWNKKVLEIQSKIDKITIDD